MDDGQKRCGCGAGHETFGACLRSKRISVPTPSHDHFSRRTRWLTPYRKAREEHIQPDGLSPKKVRRALDRSMTAGVPYRA